ncbi:MAG: glutamate-cysteine ligase family protein [Acidobacteriota bacterium]
MGEQRIRIHRDPAELHEFTLALLDDLEVLERLIDGELIETDVRRIGAEQELFLVDRSWRPAPLAMELLEHLDAPCFTTELGRYNLEINLPPLQLGGDCLDRLHRLLDDHVGRVREAAGQRDADVVLTGILPTLRKSDLGLENLTPRNRYRLLNEAMQAARGRSWTLHLKGIDELHSRHDSVMLESCCTSFQVHLQVAPEEFAPLHNIAQAVTAPVLAVAANSPMLFGRRLWRETRIPLFQQSIDTRRTSDHLREASPRVRFGEDWVDGSILELFREDIVRFRMLLGAAIYEDPFDRLESSAAPELQALCVHNGTVYRWNRACYGVTDGKPHLRIEARALPSGPTTADEVANAAFFLGLVLGVRDVEPDIRRRLRFGHVRANFQAAASLGLDAQLRWTDGKVVPADELVRSVLLPVARQGLRDAGVDATGVERYLDIIEERVASRRNGARWILGSYARLRNRATRHQVLASLTADMVRHQTAGHPVHTWPWAELKGADHMRMDKLRVEDVMTTDVYTVGPDESIDLAGKVMEWKRVRHLPVEDTEERLVGLLSCFDVIRELGRRHREDREPTVTVADVMLSDPPHISPGAPVTEALELMAERGCDALPVVEGEHLAGIVSERDFIHLVARLISFGGEEDGEQTLDDH